jgi:hypothetical protein
MSASGPSKFSLQLKGRGRGEEGDCRTILKIFYVLRKAEANANIDPLRKLPKLTEKNVAVNNQLTDGGRGGGRVCWG